METIVIDCCAAKASASCYGVNLAGGCKTAAKRARPGRGAQGAGKKRLNKTRQGLGVGFFLHPRATGIIHWPESPEKPHGVQTGGRRGFARADAGSA